jgi:hypothetical protein
LNCKEEAAEPNSGQDGDDSNEDFHSGFDVFHSQIGVNLCLRECFIVCSLLARLKDSFTVITLEVTSYVRDSFFVLLGGLVDFLLPVIREVLKEVIEDLLSFSCTQQCGCKNVGSYYLFESHL